MNRKSARVLAAIMRNGAWDRESVLHRLHSHLGANTKRSKWPQRLVHAVFAITADCVLPPTEEKLVRTLRRHWAVAQIVQRSMPAINRMAASFNWLDLPPTSMSPTNEAAATWKVPAIVTTGQLAERLEIDVTRLPWLADCLGWEHSVEQEKLRNYRYHWIRKSSAGHRLVEAPKQTLKAAQRWIAMNVLAHIPVHAAAHAYCPGRSPLTAATLHTGQHVVMRIDLQDFFPSIRAARVLGIFRTAGYPLHVARLLTGLCTNKTWQGVTDGVSEAGDDPQDLRRKYARLFQAHLPQGAPTSPALSNLCAWSLDCRLAGLAAKFGGRYSRYADDLIFSGDARFLSTLSRFRVGVLAIVHNEGFEIRNRKTLVMKHDQRQTVTGLVVNERPNISRRDFDRLKAILTNCKHHGPASQNREQHANFQAHLQGRVAHVASVNPVRGKRLRHLFNAITWDDH